MAQNDPDQKAAEKAAAAEKRAAEKAAAEAANATTPAADPTATPVVVVDPQAQQRELARIADEARAITEAHEVEGGRYLVGGRLVNADGEPIKEKRSKKDED